MIFANLLHFYQPPTQKKYWIDRITSESYRKLIKIFLRDENIKFTLNVNGVLCELWEKYGHTDIIDGIRILVSRGQVELTGSAKYHPLLPKLPVGEIRRQVLLNELSLNKYFGVVGPLMVKSRDVIPESRQGGISGIQAGSRIECGMTTAKPGMTGFFPPEMAYSPELGKVISELGYKWVICEELSFKGDVSYDRVYKEKGTDLFVFFRNRGASFKLLSGQIATAEVFLKEFSSVTPVRPCGIIPHPDAGSIPEESGSRVKPGMTIPSVIPANAGIQSTESTTDYKLDSLPAGRQGRLHGNDGRTCATEKYLLTAMDGETFGHHKVGLENCLKEIYESSAVEGVKISDLLLRFNDVEEVETRASTWAIMKSEIEKNIPFSRWDDAGNEIHKAQWELTNLAIKAVIPAPSVILSASEGSSESVSLDPSASPQDDTKAVIPHPSSVIPHPDAGSIPEESGSRVKPEMTARELLDKALHSDQYWWASAKPWWSLEMIERGAKELMDVVLGAPNASEAQKSRAKELYFFIITKGFEWQRGGKVDEIARKNDEEIVMAANEDLGKFTREEILKMIKIQEEQMKKLSESLEFERAIHPRDRIKELKSHLN